MRSLLRKFLILLIVVLVSAYSFNAERVSDPELSEYYFKKGLGDLKKLNYMDAIINFSKAFSVGPKTYYGELAYLYLGKGYALYSYAVGSRKGILASVGYLNQYPFYYKVPRFIHVQREFVGDSYILLQWYESAKNIYANLYGETERSEYMIKYGYASSLAGGIEGYNYLINLKNVPVDYLDIYFMTIGFYNFNLGRYQRVIDFLSKALNVNTYLREDVHLLFRMGVAHYKIGNIRKAVLYLELTQRRDVFKVYREKTNFYLAYINLETNNYRDALKNVEVLMENDNLFYSKLSQILFSSLWLYEDFLKVYQDRFKNYRNLLLQLAWLNIEDVYGDFPTLGIYYYVLKEKNIKDEERDLLRVKDLSLQEFAFENDLFTFDPFVARISELVNSFVYYRSEDANLIRDIYKLNRSNYYAIFGEGKGFELLVRSLVFLGDGEAKELIPYLRDEALSKFLMAKVLITEGNFQEAVKLLKEARDRLADDDRKEATLLVAYLEEDLDSLERVLEEIDFKKERFSHYRELILVKLADGYFVKGDLAKAKSYYRELANTLPQDSSSYWWALFRLALIGEMTQDTETLEWVVNKAKEGDNIWSRAIRVIWEG